MNKFIDEYTIYCTETQIKKAIKLGAKVRILIYEQTKYNKCFYHHHKAIAIPTTEQMICWLEEQIDNIDVSKNTDGTWLYIFYPTNSSSHEIRSGYKTRPEATIAAIDRVLEYISNKK